MIIIKDDFKKSHIITMKMWKLSKEEDSWARYNTIFDFSREVNETKINPTVARFKVTAEANSHPLERSGFIRIGAKDSTLVLGNLDSQAITTYNTSVTTTTTGNNSTGHSSSTSSFGKNQSTETKTSMNTTSRTHKELTGTFLLTKEQEAEILASDFFAIRLYSGTKPITISFAEDDLETLKKFLTAKPEAGN
ncbi:hypothetical protein AB3N61_02190 [Leptospira sp. WS58.C1]|uniref:hypothetical protein n=1 Tax=Leptospira cinconiae TaxID=3235173 RepID=UPI00349E7DDD